MGFKGRDTKQPIKRGNVKRRRLFMVKDNDIIFKINSYVVCTPYIV